MTEAISVTQDTLGKKTTLIRDLGCSLIVACACLRCCHKSCRYSHVLKYQTSSLTEGHLPFPIVATFPDTSTLSKLTGKVRTGFKSCLANSLLAG